MLYIWKICISQGHKAIEKCGAVKIHWFLDWVTPSLVRQRVSKEKALQTDDEMFVCFYASLATQF